MYRIMLEDTLADGACTRLMEDSGTAEGERSELPACKNGNYS